MGRPRKSPEARRLEGNPGKRPIPETSIVAGGFVVAPDHLSDDAKACIEIIKRSLPPKTYASCDAFLLSAYASAWAEHKRCVEEVNKPEFKHVEAGSQGQPVLNPWLKHMNEQARLLLSIGARLFLDPVARSALKLPEEKPASKFAGLIGRPESLPSSKH
jgi:P27 family predicted phage terminase small subunit